MRALSSLSTQKKTILADESVEGRFAPRDKLSLCLSVSVFSLHHHHHHHHHHSELCGIEICTEFKREKATTTTTTTMLFTETRGGRRNTKLQQNSPYSHPECKNAFTAPPTAGCCLFRLDALWSRRSILFSLLTPPRKKRLSLTDDALKVEKGRRRSSNNVLLYSLSPFWGRRRRRDLSIVQPIHPFSKRFDSFVTVVVLLCIAER